MWRFLRVAVLLAVVPLAGCGGPVRLQSKGAAEISQPPQRIMVVHSVRTAGLFNRRLADDLAACGVAATFLDARGKPKEALRAQAKLLSGEFKADFALEVTATMSESDQHGPRANYYRFTLTEMAGMRQVWEGSLSLHIRRVQRSGTEADVADELVWSMADANILRTCPPRPQGDISE